MSARSTPNQWKMVKLGEVTEIMKGGTPSRNVERYFRGGIPWAIPSDITALDSALYINDTATHISEEALGKSAAKLLPAGTVLLTSRATIGETVIATVPMATNQGFANFICHETLLNVFLTYYLRYIKEKLNDLASGSTFKEITKGTLLNIEIPLPPLSEQRAIAEVLSDVDGLLNALEALIAKKRAIKQATMQQLLTGKTRLPGFSGAWKMKRLGEMGNCLRGVSYDPTTDLSNYDKDSTVRLLRANNIQEAVVILTDVQHVEARKVSEFQIMQPDDILVCMANGSKELVGKAGLFRVKDGYTYTFGAFMGCFRVEPTIAEPNFVFDIFQTHGFRNFINIILAGSSINNLKPSDIESAEFQVPDRDEQRTIASVLSNMNAEIAALEQRRDKTRAIKQGMMQQLLTGRVRLSESRIGTDYADYAD